MKNPFNRPQRPPALLTVTWDDVGNCKSYDLNPGDKLIMNSPDAPHGPVLRLEYTPERAVKITPLTRFLSLPSPDALRTWADHFEAQTAPAD